MIKKIAGKDTESILALTPMQEGLLFHYLKDPRGELYFNQLHMEVGGEIDRECFEKSWNVVIEANEILRTVFRWEKLEKPIQVVMKRHTLDLKYEDLSMIGDSDERNRQWKIIKQQDRGHPFDLREVPFRVILCKMAGMHYHILISNHHILYDGWSTGIILKEFFRAYEILAKGGKLPLSPVKPGFKEFIRWHGEQDPEGQKKFWQNYLDGFETPTRLPVKQLKQSPGNPGERNYRLHLPEVIKDKLEVFVKEKHLSLAAVFYSAWGILLQKYCCMEDVVFGTIMSGRSAPIREIENMVGLFINTIPHRARLEPGETLLDFLVRINNHLSVLGKYENAPLVDIYRCCQCAGHVGEELFDTLVAVENYPLDTYLREPGPRLSIRSYSMDERPHYDLTLVIAAGEGIDVNFIYNNLLFEKETVVRLASHFSTILEGIEENAGTPVQKVEMLSAEEKHRLIKDFNRTHTGFPGAKTIQQLFEEQAAAAPDSAAVVGSRQLAVGKGEEIGETVQLTYGKLKRKSDQVAGCLRSKGIQPDIVVGITMERSIEMIVGILGILKAGGAYLPIDPEYPEERINYMLTDSNARILLSEVSEESEESKVSEGTEIVSLSELSEEFPTHLTHLTHPTQLCYIIYTSGSTGSPRGVIIEHGPVVNLLFALHGQYPLTRRDTYLLKTSYLFDVSVTELFGWFLGGGRLAVLEKDSEKDPRRITRMIELEGVTHINFVPSMFHAFVEELDSETIVKLCSLKYIFLAGEALLPGVVNRFRCFQTSIVVENIYGPTEAAVYSSWYSLADWQGVGPIPIGKPLPNVTLSILDNWGNLQPVGVPGELCISGVGLARGYLNNPESTNQKLLRGVQGGGFLEKSPPGRRRHYKTGDLCRWQADGNIEFLGRMDFQVKVRGFRIELGEIENQLIDYDGIKEAVVSAIVDKTGGNVLCAYLVPCLPGELAIDPIRNFLKQRLPDYMIPGYFVILGQIPLTGSGKVDRKALPEPGVISTQPYAAPGNETENCLVSIWAEVLGLDREQIGIDDNFFELGGHSLKATTLVSKIHKDLKFRFQLPQVFEMFTVRTQAAYMAKPGDSPYDPVRPVEEMEYYDLSYAQRRLWVLSQFEEESAAYNMVGSFDITGPFRVKTFEAAVQTLVKRHDGFRTVFIDVQGQPKQKIIKNDTYNEYRLQVADLRGLGEAEKEKRAREIMKQEATRAFDLQKGPLFLFKPIRLKDEKYILLVNIHHIISDGWSMGIIQNELLTLYNAYRQNQPDPFPGLALQYKDYTLWHNRLNREGCFECFGQYWLEKFKDKPNGLELPVDYPRKAVQTFRGGRVYFTVDSESTAGLRGLCPREQATMFMKLLAVFNLFFYHYSGSPGQEQRDIIIGSPIFNREKPELHPVVGFLVNTLVYRCVVNPEETFAQLLGKVQIDAMNCYRNQDYPFDVLVERLEMDRDLSRSPLFNVMLAFDNTGITHRELTMEGVEFKRNYQVHYFTPSVFDLVFFMDESDGRLNGEIMYNSDLFAPNTIRRMADNFLTLLGSVVNHWDQPVYSLDYISKNEYETLVYRFNDNAEGFPALTIQELVQRQVKQTPGHIAVVSADGQALTYKELNKRSNMLAHYLREEMGAAPGKLVGICIDRSLEMIIAVLGVIKSGAGYLSFDPNYPKDRIEHMLRDSRAGVIIIDRLIDSLSQGENLRLTLVNICRDWPRIQSYSHRTPRVISALTDVLYVIYTSGTTGTPNGAMLSQGLLSNLVQWQCKQTSIDSSGRCLQFTSINFCVSFQEIMCTLSSGGEVHLIDEIERQDIYFLMNFLVRRKIENLYLPFSYLNFLFNLFTESQQWDKTPGMPPDINLDNISLKHIITAGEQLKITSGLNKFLQQHPWIRLHNHYGSSEQHVVTSYTLDASSASRMPVPPAGKPIANTRIFILDDYEKPVPIGVWGELFIRGSMEFSGYIHNPGLTGKKMLDHRLFSPGSSSQRSRLYRSGDVGRWLADGNIELKGRKDSQVKIRGFRVEIGEIESKILSLDGIKDCVVEVREISGEKVLAAYVVLRDIGIREIKEHLHTYLPRYMIPQFVQLEQLPLMPNGKVDRESLPDPLPQVKQVRKKNLYHEPVLTGTRPQITDLDSLPIPDRSLVDYGKYNRSIGLAMVRNTISLQATRGCPYHCLYCHKIWPKQHVTRSAQHLYREVELYYRMGVRRFVLVDDIFNLDIANSSRFFQLIIDNGLKVHLFFPNGLRSDLLTEDYIDLMVEAGTVSVGLALETASPRLQRLIRKNLHLERLRERLDYFCRKHPGVILELFLMHGFPGETREEAQATLDFLYDTHWVDFPYLHILKIYPNTDMADLARETGITADTIERSANLAFHELPDTLPFEKSFTLQCQTDFLNRYFLSKERLAAKLPHQLKVLTKDELAEKYNSYLPVEIKNFQDLVDFIDVEDIKHIEDDTITVFGKSVDGLNDMMRRHFCGPGEQEQEPDALRILLLDLSQFFSHAREILYDGVEPPLGLMYLLTYLKREFGGKVNGKIAKSRIDFDNYDQLKAQLEAFKPQVIGIRTLTYYRAFFHQTAAMIRGWGITVPIIAGGPYATSDYKTILQDPHVDLAVLSEGELTFAELIGKIIANNGQLPGEEVLGTIAGIAFVPASAKQAPAGAFYGPWETIASESETASGLTDQPHRIRPGKAFADKIEEKLAHIWSGLLEIEAGEIHQEDNFFELGGHSLKATTMMTRIQREFNTRVKLIEIFQDPTVRGIAGFIRAASASSFAVPAHTAVPALESKQYYPVSSVQERLYFIQQMYPRGIAYNMFSIWEVTQTQGNPDEKRLKHRFKEVFLELIRRHESLRTSFIPVNDKPVQRIHEAPFGQLDAFGEETEPTLTGNNNKIIKKFIRPFDLSRAPLLRVGLIKMSEQKHILMVDMHHIISDGLSISILIKEFINIYTGNRVPALRLQYKDYSEWHMGQVRGGAIKEQKTWWLKQFAEKAPVLDLPLDYPRPSVWDFAGAAIPFEINKEETAALKSLAHEQDITLFMLLLSLYTVFLSRLSGQEDIVVGTPIAGRRHADLDGIIGMFVNTLALRNFPILEKTFVQFLGEIKENTVKAFENQDYLYEDLVEQVEVERDTGRNPLFDSMFVLQNMDVSRIEIPGLKVQPVDFETHISKFDLTLTAVEIEDRLAFTFEYCTNLFKEETIRRFSGFFKRTVSAVLENHETRLSRIEIITPEEKNRVLLDFNDTGAEYPRDKTIHQLFAEQVEKRPDNIAGIGEMYSAERKAQSIERIKGRHALTYRELNNQSNRLAHILTGKGVKPDIIVGIMVERSIEMIIGIWGILKAGGAYLPIDPNYPQERIDFMLKDSGAAILLTEGNDFNCQLSVKKEVPTAAIFSNPQPAARSSQLAYVIYTSGSTGKPKGVMIEHRSLANFIKGMTDIFEFTGTDCILSLTTISFDIFGLETILPLTKGSKVIMGTREEQLNPGAAALALDEEDVTILQVTPSRLALLLSNERSAKGLKYLKYLLVGGEAFPGQLLGKTREVVEGRIFNLYGPTETTIWSTVKEVSKGETLNIGKPTANTRLYIMNRSKILQAIGVAGELWISGTGLARGYINKGELTNRKFIINPYETGEQMYHTGDIARWLPDGNIDFLGRKDNQVKIRGFRIELAEIKNHLEKHDGMREAVVLDREDKNGDRHLCAYVVTGNEYVVSELREYLSQHLPNYMIPSYFISMEKIPLTPNGKVDRRALPEPEIEIGENHIAPRNKLEAKLIEIWSEVLGIEKGKISINANFFRVGGHSLKATVMTTKIHKELNVKVPLTEVFKTPTIKGLAGYINGLIEEQYTSIDAVEKKDYYVLSSMQKRMYILQQMELTSIVYNIPSVISLEEIAAVAKLEDTFKQLIQHHESLRTSFTLVKENPVQQVHEHVDFNVHYFEVESGEEVKKIIDRFVKPFALDQAPLLKVELVKVKGDKYILLVDMHHIISDGVSNQILVKDFMTLYRGEKLPKLHIQYKDFSEWQNHPGVREAVQGQEAYWLKQFEGEIPVLNLPYDYVRPAVQSFEGSFVSFEIPAELTAALESTTSKEGVTLYMVILALLNILLSKLGGQEDIVIGSPAAGRGHADLDKVIGMFVNTLALRNCPDGEISFKEFLQEVKERALQAFENQDYPFEDLVERVAVNRDISRNPLFDVMFVLQNMIDDTVEAAGGGANISSKQIGDSQSDLYAHINTRSKFDLTLLGVHSGEKLLFSFEYCTKLFKRNTIERVTGYFKQMVTTITKNIEKNISAIEIVSEQEKRQLLYDFNETRATYPRHKEIQQLFEEQVERTPDHIAAAGQSLRRGAQGGGDSYPAVTYRELNDRSNQLDRLLREKGVKPGFIVAVMVDRSIEMVIGILGILKSGSAYLPIDPAYPQERIDYILADSNAKVLLTASTVEFKAAAGQNEIMDIADGLPSATPTLSSTCQGSPDALAYVIYTSGSTGWPKGVLIGHRGVVNLVCFHQRVFKEGINARMSQVASPAFDAMSFELWPCLLNGASLHIVPDDVRMNVQRMKEWLIKYRITISFQSTMMGELLLKEDWPEQSTAFQALRVAGDRLTSYPEKSYPFKVYNLYGPTEDTIWTTWTRVDVTPGSSKCPPIGKPVANHRVHIVGSAFDLKPIGVAGELCISGDGLARGYLNNPGLTAEKFVRLHRSYISYRTGDLARWRQDGNIEFLGRIDFQVKIRGYRIELGEIENRLVKHPEIKEAVVLAQEDSKNEKYLVAYIVPQSAGSTISDKLRQYLTHFLPDYMIPAHFVRLERIPLTVNGKIERKALPDFEVSAGEAYIAPSNEIEEKLVRIWSDILSIDKDDISTDASFFDLGGHSLRATVMMGTIWKELKVKIPLVEIFKSPTIKGLAGYVSEALEETVPSIEAVEKREYYELSSMQKRLFFLNRMEGIGTAYNLPSAVLIEGKLDRGRFEAAIRGLIERHEALRTSFVLFKGRPIQRIHEKVDFEIEYAVTNEQVVTDVAASFIRPFHLDKAPLLRIGLVEVAPDRYILIFDMHHIVSDGVSMAVLAREFMSLYAGDEFMALPWQYKDIAGWQDKFLSSDEFKRQQAYWLERFSGELPLLKMPTDYPRPGIQNFQGNCVGLCLDRTLSESLKDMAKEMEVTLFMLLLAAFNVLLHKYSGQEDIIIGTPIAGRNHKDVSNIIGMFVNTLAMRNYPRREKAVKTFLAEVKENALNAYENQNYPLEELINKLKIPKDPARNPIFDVLFVMENLDMPRLKIKGLTFTPYEFERKISHVDLVLYITEPDDGINLKLEYSTSLFKRSTAEQMLDHYVEILEQVVEKGDIKLNAFEISHGLMSPKAKKLEMEFGF